jgi:hypothetical protein
MRQHQTSPPTTIGYILSHRENNLAGDTIGRGSIINSNDSIVSNFGGAGHIQAS